MTSSQFPAYIRAEYQDGGGFRQFEAEMASSAKGAKQAFDSEFRQITSIISGSLRKASEGSKGIDFGAGAMRQSAAGARFQADALKATADAARNLALITQDTSQKTTAMVQAARAAAIEAGRFATAAEAESAALNRLSSATNAAISNNERLATSYRNLFSEQARAARAEVRTASFQSAINSKYAPGLTRSSATDNGAGFSALAGVVETQRAQEALAIQYEALRQAEAGAANGAAMLTAALRGTALESGRVTISAKESAQAFIEAERAQEALAREVTAFRASLSPANAAQERYNATLATANRLLAAGAISTKEFAQAQDLATRQSLEFAEVNQAISNAISVPRNASGSLDLGTNNFRRTADDAQAFAVAAREVAQAAERAAQATGVTTRAAAEYAQAARAAAVAAEAEASKLNAQATTYERLQAEINQTKSATDRLVQSQRQGTNAGGMVVNSMGSQRFAMIQVGQQLQDVTVGFASGQRAATIFAQQLPQLAFAMTGFGGVAGKVGSFLAGPWGVAIFAATTALGFLAEGMLSAEKAAESQALAIELTKNSFITLQKAVEEYNRSQERTTELTLAAAETQRDSLRVQLAMARAIEGTARARIADLEAQYAQQSINTNNATEFGNAAASSSALQIGRLQEITNAVDGLERNLREAERAASELSVAGRMDEATGATQRYERAVRNLRIEQTRGQMSAAEYERRFEALTRSHRAETEAIRESQRTPRSRGSERFDTSNFISPVTGHTSSGYGRRASPGGIGSTNHGGVDFAVPIGTRVNAAAAGTVITVGRLGGYGNVVIVDHGAGTTTRYAHLSRATVTQGQRVQAGDQIALSGNTGRSTGPHLHYEVRRGNRAVDPRTGRYPTDEVASSQAADRAAQRAERAEQERIRAAETLQRAIESGYESASRLRGQFDIAPRDIDRTNAAMLDLDQIIRDAQARLAAGGLGAEQIAQLNATIANAQTTKNQVIPDYLRRPITDRIDQGERDMRIQRLRIQGYDDEAEALALQFDVMRQLGIETEDQLAAELDRRHIARERYQVLQDQLKATQDLVRAQERLDRAGRSVRSQLNEVQNIYSTIERGIAQLPDDARGALLGVVNGIRQQFNDLFARQITDSLFGDAFAQLQQDINDNPRIRADRAVEETSGRLTSSFETLMSAVNQTADILNGVPANDNGDLVVNGARASGSTNAINQYQRAFTVMFERYLGKGSPLAATLGKAGGTALEGAAYGGSISSLIFGSRGSQTGASIGGALGNFAGKELGKSLGSSLGRFASAAGPIGSIVGGLAGNLIGGLFKKSTYGSSVITGGSSSSVTGTNADIKGGLASTTNNVQSALSRIASQLGGDVGNFSVSIGKYKDDYRVSASGSANVGDKKYANRNAADTIYVGTDEAEAVRVALLNAIQDGAIKGIREGSVRLLKAGKDLDAAVQKALSFESVFTRLKAYKDPVGAALDSLDKEFTNLKSIFAEAGASAAEYAQLEELYGIERAKAVKDAGEKITASLRSLFDELTTGDNGRSLRDRLGAARAKYDPLAARVAAGDTTAYDDFAAAAKTLLDIQRQFSGSQTPYFALLDQITGLSKQQIDAQAAIASAATNRDTPFNSAGEVSGSAANDNAAVVSAIQTQTDALLSGILNGLDGLGSSLVNAMLQQAVIGNSAGNGFNFASAV